MLTPAGETDPPPWTLDIVSTGMRTETTEIDDFKTHSAWIQYGYTWGEPVECMAMTSCRMR